MTRGEGTRAPSGGQSEAAALAALVEALAGALAAIGQRAHAPGVTCDKPPLPHLRIGLP